MKTSLIAVVSLAALVASAEPAVSRVSLVQNPVSGAVTVNYDLTGEPAVVTFGGSLNGEVLDDATFVRVGGDVNRLVAAGTGRSFVWCPRGADGSMLDVSGFVPKVTAWPTNCPPDYMAIDLRGSKSGGPAAYDIAYYTSTNAFPFPISDRRYKTDILVMRKIPARDVEWRMGSPTTEKGRTANEETTHIVKLTSDYYIGVYELTDRQGRLAAGQQLGSVSTYGIVTNVSVYQELETYPACAMNYASIRGSVWPTNLHDSTAGYITRFQSYTGLRLDLPTDAQWEFACRAGESAALYTGKELSGTSEAPELDDIAWYVYNSASPTVYFGNRPFPHPVGLKRPNAFGLYDMLGNVSEACLDWYQKITYDGGPDPATTLYENPVGPDENWDEDPTNGSYKLRRVARGGSYSCYATCCRSAHRHGWNKGYGDGPGYKYISGQTTADDQKLARGGLGIRLVCPAIAVH